MRKLFSSIFGRAENADKVIDGVGRGLDKIIFTKEERSDANLKLGEWYLEWLKATSGAALARRFIAILVTLLWCLLTLCGISASAVGRPELADYIFQVMLEVVIQPFSIIIGFYFLTHTVRAYKKEK